MSCTRTLEAFNHFIIIVSTRVNRTRYNKCWSKAMVFFCFTIRGSDSFKIYTFPISVAHKSRELSSRMLHKKLCIQYPEELESALFFRRSYIRYIILSVIDIIRGVYTVFAKVQTYILGLYTCYIYWNSVAVALMTGTRGLAERTAFLLLPPPRSLLLSSWSRGSSFGGVPDRARVLIIPSGGSRVTSRLRRIRLSLRK